MKQFFFYLLKVRFYICNDNKNKILKKKIKEKQIGINTNYYKR